MDRETIAVHLKEGNKFKRQGELEKAIASYKMAIKINPDSAWSYHNLGEALAKQGQIEEAIASYKRAIELNPNSAWSHYNLEELLTKKGSLDDGGKDYKIAGDFLKPTEENLDVGLANSLLEEGKINEAIASYEKVVELQPDAGQVWSKLANAYYVSKNWEAAIDSSRKAIALMPDNYQCYKILGWCLKKRRRMEEAIAAFYKVIELNPKDSEGYYLLGEIFRLKGNLEEAIAIYRKGLEKFPEEIQIKTRLEQLGEDKSAGISQFYQQGMQWVEQKELEKAIFCYEKILANQPQTANKTEKYLSLGVALVKLGKLEEIIDCYDRVFRKSVSNIEFYYQFSIGLSQAGLLKEAVGFFQRLPKPKLEGENKSEVDVTCDLIWDLFNSSDLGDLDREISADLTISQSQAYQYFSEFQPYQVLVSSKLKETERAVIEKLGISLEYLQLMTVEDNELEKIYVNNFEGNSENIEERKTIVTKRKDSYYPPVEFPQTIVEFKYFYTVCPLSGRVVRSNDSFYIPGSSAIVYRFLGKEVFYVVAGGFTGEKASVYLPKFNLFIYLPNTRFVNSWVKDDVIYLFQSYVVSNWKYVEDYLVSTADRPVATILACYSNLGHYFWQDITGVYYLLENNLLEKVDCFCVGKHEYLELSSIFPEIPDRKIVKTSKMSAEEQFRWFLENNYVCLRITDNFIKQNLAETIYQTARFLCSKDFLKSVENAKENSGLLLWINIRTHNKSWVSQVKGYSLIVNKLREEFPKLSIGVIIDGTPDAASCAEEIMGKLKPEVKVYNTLGCPLVESIVWAHYIDAYVATVGSGLVMTSWLSDKPGVAHGDRAHLNQQVFWSDMKENSIPPVFVKSKHIISQYHRMYGNYQLNWRVIYNYLVEILHSSSFI